MLSSADMVSLKAKVKAEMARRNCCGSLSEYAGTQYDYTNVPREGTAVEAEHGQKTTDLLLRIKDHGDLVLARAGEKVPDSVDKSLLAYVDSLAAETMTAAVSSCRGACTGLCLAGCSDSCGGCKGSCSASCGTGCASGAMN